MFYLLLIIIVILFVIHVSVRYTKSGRLVDKIPGPTPLPIFGNLLSFFNATPEQIWTYFRENSIKYNPIGRIWLGSIAFIVTSDPDNAKIVLSSTTNTTPSRVYKNLKPCSKNGLITSTGDIWHHRRKILNSAFHKNILNGYSDIINKNAKKLVENIKSQGDESIQSLLPLSKTIALNIICETTMNINVDNVDVEKMEEYRHAIDDFLALAIYRTLRPYITDWVIKFLSVGRKLSHVIKTILQFSDKVIQERKQYLERTGFEAYQNFINDTATSVTQNDIIGKQKRLGPLDLLLSAQKEGLIDEEGIRDEVVTFIAAGHDTVAIALVFTLMLLAENKEAQNIARAEAFEIMDKYNNKLTVTEIQKMEYIERCIRESLRLFPSVPQISRCVIKDMQLKNYIIPSGHELSISILDTHRDPKIWPHPDKFDPDRFLPQNIKGRHSFAYLPFGGGPRSCIGQKFAITELISIIAHVLTNFYLEPIDFTADLKFQLHVILLPTHPVHVKFIKLDKTKKEFHRNNQ